MFIQNEFDPVYSYEELKQILENNPPVSYQLINNIGNKTHEYLDYENLSKIAMQFLK